MFTNLKFQLGVSALLVALMAGVAQPNFAAPAAAPEFDSPEQAAAALYTAIRKGDKPTIVQLIGPLADSGDSARDTSDRDLFLLKYAEMHRLVNTSDGNMTLYIGAENWPFPVPLVSNGGKWHFDTETGAREIVFRSIGENETSAIDTCRAIAQEGTAAAVPAQEPSHGYYFRLTHTPSGNVVVAYPSQYGSTGVMTFAATANGKVYEKNLGPKTEARARAITEYKPDRTWLVANQ